MFQERLKNTRIAAGLTQAEMAERLFMTQQAYSKYEKGLATPNPETLARIADLLDVSLDFLLDRDQAADGPPASTGGVWVPVLGRVAAGLSIAAVEEVLGYEEIPTELAAQRECFALRIGGDSMEPRIREGDVVIVQKQETCETGDLAVVLVNGGDATVKRIKKGPEGLMLIPNNPAYEPMFYSNEQIKTLPVTIVGRVMELRAKF